MPKTKPAKAKRLDKVDKNFAAAPATENLYWIDAFDPRFALRGLGWLKENQKAKNFRRLPGRAEASMSEGVRILLHHPSSVFVSFFTDATLMSVRLANEDTIVMGHMPGSGSNGVELYFREGARWLPMATAIPPSDRAEFECALIRSGLAPAMREYRLYLPLYVRVNKLSIGFSAGAKVKPSPAPAGTKPIVFYGTSITQGGCASTAGSDFVSTLGRALETEVINFGFSGNGRGEPEVAQLIREIDAELFVLDYVANCDLERLRATLPSFVRILREKHPRLPIVLLGPVAFNNLLWDDDSQKEINPKRDFMMRFYLEAKAAGDPNLHFIDGWGVLPPGLEGAYVDGVHPTSAGFALIAERLEPLLRMVRMTGSHNARTGKASASKRYPT